MAITNPSKRPTLATLTAAQCESLLNRIGSQVSTQMMLRDYCIVLLMLDAGLRIGELVQLTLHDLYFVDAPVQALTIRSEIAKRKVSRTIPLTRRLQAALTAMRNDTSYPAETLDSPAFRAHGHTCDAITPRAVQKMLDRYAVRSIGMKVNPHMLRHTFATNMLRVTDIRVVQELLGHASICTTQGYTHPTGDDLRAAVDKLHPGLL